MNLKLGWFGKVWLLRATAALLFLTGTGTFLFSQDQAKFEDLVEQASAARNQNDTARAIELYSQAVELNPNWPQGWWFLGFLQYTQGSYAAARDALSKFILLTSEPGPAIALRGICEFETGEYEKSLADIQLGMSSGAANDPRSEQFFRSREAMLLTRLGRFDQALKSYSFFAQRKVTDPELLVAVGLAALRRPLLPKEVGTDREMLEQVGSAVFAFLAGDESTAKQQFQSLLGRFPGTPNMHYVYGFFLFASDPEAALSEFQSELQLSASNENAQVMTAWVLLLENHAPDALSYAREAQEKHPELAAAQLVLGRALSETGDPKTGLTYLHKAAQLDPDDLEIHIALAKSYSRTGDRLDAQRERRICLEMTKDGTNRLALP